MRKIMVLIFLTLLLSSCSVITMEPFRTADTLGGPLHFRAGAGVQMGQFVGQQRVENEFHNSNLAFPAVNLFLGLGILKNIDLYASAGVAFPSLGAALGVKYQFYDKLGLKVAVIPTLRFSNFSNTVNVFGNNETFKYMYLGGETPVAATFSLFNFILLTAGAHVGYYRMAFETDNEKFYYNLFSYGVYLMPELKVFALRLTPSVDFRWYFAPGAKLVNETEGLKNVYPSISLSLQF
ncbi:MAG: hypothetical protein PHW02_03185 [bacterium]|nr:hypothetical protein [bacterium]